MMAILAGTAVLAAGCTKSPEPSKGPTAYEGGEITGEITVSCYESALYQSFLEEAARQFEEKYPGTRVKINTFSAMPEAKSSEQDGKQTQIVSQVDDPQGRADYISKTSTSLMSGQGADLLAMDVLPVCKYAESGLLENIKEYMDGDPEFQRSDYRDNILNALEFKDGIWFLPLNYSFDYYAYDSTLAGQDGQMLGPHKSFTSAQLAQMGKAGYNGTDKIFPAPAYLSDGDGDLFSLQFGENYRNFVDMEHKKASFTDGNFEKMITGIKSLADEGFINRSAGQSDDPSDLLKTAGNPTKRFMFKPKTQLSLIRQTNPDPSFKMTVASSAVGSGIEDDDQIAGICAEESGVVPFTYGLSFGINSNSANKSTSWAFLKYLLSYEVQSSPGMSFVSLPIHNQARFDRTEQLYRTMMAGGKELNDTQKQALQSYWDTIEAMADQVNGYTFKDTAVLDMVMKETAYYFDGTKSAEQVCRTLQNKVELYLNE